MSYTGSFCGFGSSTAGTDSAACASTGAVSGARRLCRAIPIESTATPGSATGLYFRLAFFDGFDVGIEGSFMAKKYPSPPPAISPIAIHSHSRLRRTWLFGGSAFLCRFFICGFFFRRFGFGLRGCRGCGDFPRVCLRPDWPGRARGEFRLLRARKSRSRRMAARGFRQRGVSSASGVCLERVL